MTRQPIAVVRVSSPVQTESGEVRVETWCIGETVAKAKDDWLVAHPGRRPEFTTLADPAAAPALHEANPHLPGTRRGRWQYRG
jgi:hypothetical protein